MKPDLLSMSLCEVAQAIRKKRVSSLEVARAWSLPAGAPTFNGGASMEATFFLTPPLERVVDELGRALLERKLQ